MTYEDYQKTKWLSVYGASIAIQSNKYLEEDKLDSLSSIMPIIKQKARQIADLALDGESK